MISVSDLIHVILLYKTIDITRTREENETYKQYNFYSLFYYISNAISLGTSHQYASIKDFETRFLDIIHDNDLFELSLSWLEDITSFDSFLSFMMNIKDIFEVSSQESMNLLKSPHKIASNSILGIFIRKIHAIWLTLLFQEQCQLFEKYRQFLDHTLQSLPVSSLTSFFHQAEVSLVANDIFTIEDSIHSFFDHMTESDSLFHIDKLTVALKDLEFEENQGCLHQMQQQHSMLSLALTWLHAGNTTLAQSAVEEALKTSHQRGDHISVTKCLMIFFHLFYLENRMFDKEELLRRCLMKCQALELRDLVSEVALLYAEYKFKSQVDNEDLFRVYFDSLPSANSSSNTSNSTNLHNLNEFISNIFHLLSLGSHGDMKLTVDYALKVSIPKLDDCLAPLNTMGMMLPPSKSQVQPEVLANLSPNHSKYLLMQACLLAEIWNRLHLYEIAMNTCQRTLTIVNQTSIVTASTLQTQLKSFLCQVMNIVLHSSQDTEVTISQLEEVSMTIQRFQTQLTTNNRQNNEEEDHSSLPMDGFQQINLLITLLLAYFQNKDIECFRLSQYFFSFLGLTNLHQDNEEEIQFLPIFTIYQFNHKKRSLFEVDQWRMILVCFIIQYKHSFGCFSTSHWPIHMIEMLKTKQLLYLLQDPFVLFFVNA